MNRLIISLLCICGLVVCAFVAYLAYKQQNEIRLVEQAPPPITCEELLEKVPTGLQGLTLTEFRSGKHFVTDDADDNGEWERVMVPVFPSNLESLGTNYRAIILCIADAPDKSTLSSKLKSDEIVAEYWFAAQELDKASYSRLAENYKSMDFNQSIILYSGYPKSEVANSVLLWGSLGGGLLSLLVLGWQSMSLILAGIKNESRRKQEADPESDDSQSGNRAGLPTDLDDI